MARNSRRGRPRYQWIRESTLPTEILNGVASGLLTVSDAEITGEGLAAPTLVRTRGNILMFLDSATTSANETQRLGVGIIVTKSGVTGAEVGGPIANPNIEWLYWSTFNLSARSVITSNGVTAPPGMLREQFDVKAMRKIHKSDVHLIVENPGDSDAHVFVGVSWSLLFQE